MAKGGDTTTENKTGDLPAYVKPYVQEALAMGQTAARLPYTPYQNPRLANFSGETTQAFDMIGRQAAAGTPGIDAAMNTAGRIAGYQGGTFNAGQTSSGNVTAGQLGPTGNVTTGNFNFTGMPDADIGAYMDPYIGNVLDVQKQRATQAFQEQQAGRDAAAVAAGAFGGDRRFVQDSLANRDLNQQMQAIDATGLSEAFNRATGMFSSDEARRLAAYEGDAARRLTADTGNMDRSLQAGMFDITNRLGADTGNVTRRLASDTGNVDRQLQAAMASEESRRLGSSLGLSGAQTQGELSRTRQDMGLGLAEALSGVGSRRQQREQAGLDLAYQDFVNQRDYPRQQADFYRAMISGTPVAPSSTTETTTPTPDFLSQLLGLAVGGAGVYDLLRPR